MGAWRLMAGNRKLIVEIIGDSRSLEKAFKRANDSSSKFDKTMKGLAYGGAAAVGIAFLGIGAALKRGFGEVMEGQKVLPQTNAVLKSTGGVAGVTAKHVDRMANSLANLTGIDDEAIGAAENMLLTFTNVRNGVGKNNKIFDEATKTVIDLATAMGRDPVDAAIMVGKALNDTEVNAKGTITGWSALRRVGVKVSADMMKQAADFIKAGKPMRAQRLLLRELNTEFGGSAKAFGNTLPGAFGKLRNALDNITGAFAKGLVPVVRRAANLLTNKLADPKFVARLERLGRIVGTKLLNAFLRFTKWFGANWPAIQKGLIRTGRILQRIANIMQRIVDLAEKVGKFIGKFGFLNEGPGGSGKITTPEQVANLPPGLRRKVMGQVGVTVNGNVNVQGVENPKQLADTLQRNGKKRGAQTRGRQQVSIWGR